VFFVLGFKKSYICILKTKTITLLKTKIKAAQISNLTDARYFAAWYSEWLGFCCDTASPNYVSPALLHAIRDWIEGPQIVGEFGAQDAVQIREAVEALNLDAVQVGFFYDAARLKTLNGLTVIREIVIDPNEGIDLAPTLEALSPFVECFLLEFNKNNISWNDIKNDKNYFNINVLKSLCEKYCILLSINIKGNEANELLKTLQPEGLNVFGGDEEKVGFKSYDEMDELFEAVAE